MASQARIVITVTSQRAASRITYSTKGKYISLSTNGLSNVLARQPVFTTVSAQEFWEAVLPLVLADITAGG
jgi:hypothetical protein